MLASDDLVFNERYFLNVSLDMKMSDVKLPKPSEAKYHITLHTILCLTKHHILSSHHITSNPT